MRNWKRLGNIYCWIAPLAGAFLTAFFLAIRAVSQWETDGDVLFPFIAWFLFRSIMGYLLTLPLMLIAGILGLRHVFGFMAISLLAAIPYEWYVSNPWNAWQPTEAELNHGFYWASFVVSVVLSAGTGICFSYGISQSKTA